jgi:hypothetical protein
MKKIRESKLPLSRFVNMTPPSIFYNDTYEPPNPNPFEKKLISAKNIGREDFKFYEGTNLESRSCVYKGNRNSYL